MEWVRGWTYELRWAPGHSGIRLRRVETPGQLRAVVEWARRNPRIEKCSYQISWQMRGERIVVCPRGHSLLQPLAHYAQKLDLPARWVSCADCPGHHATRCPACEVMVYDPPPGPDCGPPPEGPPFGPDCGPPPKGAPPAGPRPGA